MAINYDLVWKLYQLSLSTDFSFKDSTNPRKYLGESTFALNMYRYIFCYFSLNNIVYSYSILTILGIRKT